MLRGRTLKPKALSNCREATNSKEKGKGRKTPDREVVTPTSPHPPPTPRRREWKREGVGS